MTGNEKWRVKFVGCPTALPHSRQIGLLRPRQIAEVATGCPLALQQPQQIPFLPKRGADQRKEARETVAPVRQETQVAQQQINQQRRPDLPPHRVGAGAQKIGQLQGLLDLLEEDFDLPTAPIQFDDARRAPLQVVAQEGHRHFAPVHFHQRHDAPHQLGILPAPSRGLEPDQSVAQDFARGAFLITPHDLEAEVVLGAGDPENHSHAEVGQVGEVHVSLVKYDDFTRLDPGAEFPGAIGVVMPGGVHDGKTREKTLQVQPQMTFGGGFAAAMTRPVQARSNQRNGGRVHQMNRAAKFPGEALAGRAAEKARREIAQVFEDRPEELLSHFGGADFVGVGKIIAGGSRGPAQTGERTRMQAQGVTDIIETDAVGQLGIEQGDRMAPGTEGADFLIHSGITGEFGNKKIGNEVANLAQQIQFRGSWNGFVFLFHPCPVAGQSKSFQLFRQFLWDGCE